MKTRHQAREAVLQALYAYSMGGGGAGHVFQTLIRPVLAKDKGAVEFAERLFTQTLAIETESTELIDQHLRNWTMGRVANLDRLILRMAVCEFLCFEDIPPKVTINEAIELGKEYSTQKSGSFINGILDAALNDLREKKRIKKSGRGLIGMDSQAS